MLVLLKESLGQKVQNAPAVDYLFLQRLDELLTQVEQSYELNGQEGEVNYLGHLLVSRSVQLVGLQEHFLLAVDNLGDVQLLCREEHLHHP